MVARKPAGEPRHQPARDSKPLTPKEERFVQEYLIDLNATQSAIRAGYSSKTARAIGYENLTKPHVRSAVDAAMAIRADRTEITADKVLAELAKIGFSDIRNVIRWRGGLTEDGEIAEVTEDLEAQPHGGALKRSHREVLNVVEFVDSEDLDPAAAAAISEVSQSPTGGLRIKLHDKKGALVDIGRHLGMFHDHIQLEHSGHIASMTPQQRAERLAELEARRRERRGSD